MPMTSELPGLEFRAFVRPSMTPAASLSQLMRPKQRKSQNVKAFLAQQNISFDAPPLTQAKGPRPTPDRLRHRHENSHDVLPKSQTHSRNTDMSTYGRRLVPTLPSTTDACEQPIISEHDHSCHRNHPKNNTKAQQFVLESDSTNNNHPATITRDKEPLIFWHDKQLMKRDLDAALSDALVVLDVRPPQRSMTMLEHTRQNLESVKSAFSNTSVVSVEVDTNIMSAVDAKPLRTIGLTYNTHLRDRFGCYTEK